MPLPSDVLDAQRRMNHAEDALQAYVDSGEHKPHEHHILVENLERAIREYLDRIASLRP